MIELIDPPLHLVAIFFQLREIIFSVCLYFWSKVQSPEIVFTFPAERQRQGNCQQIAESADVFFPLESCSPHPPGHPF